MPIQNLRGKGRLVMLATHDLCLIYACGQNAIPPSQETRVPTHCAAKKRSCCAVTAAPDIGKPALNQAAADNRCQARHQEKQIDGCPNIASKGLQRR